MIRFNPPITKVAVCQETKSTKTPAIKRPLIPPMAVPEIYSPMAKPISCC